MKTIPCLALSLAAGSLSLTLGPRPCLAQEVNPYLQEAAKKATSAAAGESFLCLEEHILVPADRLDAWLAGHSLAKGAEELRAAAQEWIAAEQATLAHSALSTGVIGREFTNETKIEQIYATEYEPARRRDEWQMATSFETRNLGYMLQGDAIREQGQLVVRAETGTVRMLPHGSWDHLAEATRQPSDIFIPRFRSLRNSQSIPRDQSAPASPSTAGGPGRRGKTFPAYTAGKVHLVLRADEEIPEPVAKVPRGNLPEYEQPAELAPDRLVRLIFFRGEPLGEEAAAGKPLTDDFQVEMRMVRIDQFQLSDWLQQRDLATASKELNQAVESWLQEGSAQVIRTLSGEVHGGSSDKIVEIEPYEFPTEFKPGGLGTSADGKTRQREFATPSSFERRNVGTSLSVALQAEGSSPLLQVMLERVIHGCDTVHDRILRDGKWEPNITFPRFSSNAWETVVRPRPGEWTFIGSGGDFAEDSDVDPDHAVLAFIKAE